MDDRAGRANNPAGFLVLDQYDEFDKDFLSELEPRSIHYEMYDR